MTARARETQIRNGVLVFALAVTFGVSLWGGLGLEAMKQRGIQQKRSLGRRDDTFQIAGAIPSARLFGLKRQYGDSFTQRPKDVLKAEGLYWGD